MVQEMPRRDPAELGNRLFADDNQYMLIKGVYNLKKTNKKRLKATGLDELNYPTWFSYRKRESNY